MNNQHIDGNNLKIGFLLILTTLGCKDSNVELTNQLSPNVVIVNIGETDRQNIAESIAKINKTRPKVIGVDIFLFDLKGNVSDTILSEVLKSSSSLVLGYGLKGRESIKIDLQHPLFYQNSSVNLAYASLLENPDPTIVGWTPFIFDGNDKHVHFSYVVAELFDANKVHYKIPPYGQEPTIEQEIFYKRTAEQYTIIEYDEVDEYSDKLFRDKIVLFGYAGTTNEDKKFTPMGDYIDVEDDEPDTYGIVILANIISYLIGE